MSGLVITEPLEDLEPSGEPFAAPAAPTPAEIEQLGTIPLAADVPPVRADGNRYVDELQVAIVRVCGYRWSEIDATKRRQIAVAAQRLAHVRATPDAITRRADNYRAHFPNAPLTPMALANQWAHCIRPPAGTVPAKGPDMLRAVLAQATNPNPDVA